MWAHKASQTCGGPTHRERQRQTDKQTVRGTDYGELMFGNETIVIECKLEHVITKGRDTSPERQWELTHEILVMEYNAGMITVRR